MTKLTRSKRKVKKILEHRSGAQKRTLVMEKDGSYTVRIDMLDYSNNSYKRINELKFDMFGAAFKVVNYQEKEQ